MISTYSKEGRNIQVSLASLEQVWPALWKGIERNVKSKLTLVLLKKPDDLIVDFLHEPFLQNSSLYDPNLVCP